MRADEKLILINFAAYEGGKSEIDYPVQHSLVFYLIERGFKFPAVYNFIPATWAEYGDVLMSRQLEFDLDTLVTRGSLEITHGSPFISMTEAGIAEAKPLAQKLEDEGEKYQTLKDTIMEALTYEQRVFLQQCYRMYIQKEYLVTRG